MNTNVVIVTVILISFLIVTDAKTSPAPVTYLSYVDNMLGFYKVIDLTTHKPSPYYNRTLIINKGDAVEWMNDADNVVLTVASDQKFVVNKQELFENVRLNIHQTSNSYTFNDIGTYTFYIKEYLSRRQTIIVLDTDAIPTPTPAPIPTPTLTYINSTPTSTMSSIPISTNPPPPPSDSMSTTQILSIIVAILSIAITYKVGKDTK